MRPRPRHGLPLVDEQKRALVALLEGNSVVLFNKSQQPQHLKNKTEAWEQITRRFNEMFPAKDGFTPRTTYCLKRWWDNYKQKVKREQAERKLHWQETGEDAPLPETGDPLYVAASPLLRAELALGDSSMDSMPCPQSSSPRLAIAVPPPQLTAAAAACLSSILRAPPPQLTAAAAACLSSVQGAPPPQLTTAAAAAAACPSLQGTPPPPPPPQPTAAAAAAACLSSVRGAPPPQLTAAATWPSSLHGAPPPPSPPPITAAAAVPACLSSVKGAPPPLTPSSPPPAFPPTSSTSHKSEQIAQADCYTQNSGQQSPQEAVLVIVKEEPLPATPSPPPPPSPVPATSSVPQKSEQITQADCYRQISGQQASLHELRLKYLREEHEYQMEVLKTEKEYLELKKKNELEMGLQRERFEIERHKQKMQHDRKLFILQKKVLLAQLRKNK